MADQIETDIALARPGDTLIIRVDPGVTAKQVQEFREQAARELPDLRLVVVAAAQAIVVQREDEPDDA